MKILITGGTGFVGSNLTERLKRKHKIAIISREMKVFKGIKIVIRNLNNLESAQKFFKNIDVVIHLAYSKNNYEENIIMTRNVINASKKFHVKKIILLSSMSAKRSHPDSYGKNKIEIEQIIKESGINYTILRPSIIYGPGSKSFDFIIEKIKKLPFVPIMGSGKYYIYPVSVDDVVFSIERCLDNKKTDRKEYDLPGGERIYFIDLINELKKSAGINKRNIKIPLSVCKMVSIIFPKVISRENINNMTENSLADFRDARKDFDYNPVKFSEGVKNGLI
ncbi:MAG: NAD-dependent epimerase/dehydratase family protein [Nanoarchaeota archaeon]|nr:NAD-dependent epimerase/dehydratase family protein [Nanoarchaeota archaeon]MBU4086029.1 NAD-dependent epimerase/dehydratase family protein [Nanoarchaeota archaeon]